jgi:RNA polymerase sigma factor (sigma-70 family)
VVRISTIADNVQTGEGLTLMRPYDDRSSLVSKPGDISLRVIDTQPYGSYVPHDSFEEADCEELLLKKYNDNLIGKYNRKFDLNRFAEEKPTQSVKRNYFSKKDEPTFFLIYNFARYRIEELSDRINSGSYSDEDVRECRSYNELASKVRDTITDYNLALVIAMAKRTNIPNVDFSELVSEGNMALLRAINKFDVSRGFAFSTYACRVILKSYSRLASKDQTHRKRFIDSIDPEYAERDNSVDKKSNQRKTEKLEDLNVVLACNRADLTGLERMIIDNRFALGPDGEKKTLVVIGNQIGVSKERVRQIQRVAMAKLRRAFRKQHAWAD